MNPANPSAIEDLTDRHTVHMLTNGEEIRIETTPIPAGQQIINMVRSAKLYIDNASRMDQVQLNHTKALAHLNEIEIIITRVLSMNSEFTNNLQNQLKNILNMNSIEFFFYKRRLKK